MRHVKIALMGLAIAGVAAGGFLRWQASPSRLESKALDLYMKGESKQAYEQLVTLENHIPVSQLLLLQAYTLREGDLLSRSTQRLHQGIQSLHDSNKKLSKTEKKLLLELALNLSLNGYLSLDSALFEQGLQLSQEIDPQSHWVFALQALKAQQARQFLLAAELADKASKRTNLSNWMQKSFGEVFGKHWDVIVHARALIEGGKTVAAREMMSQIPLRADTQSQLRLLKCLIQIREGQNKPLEISLGYFQLAYSYLKNLPMEPGSTLAGDYEEIATAFSKQGLTCLKSGMMDHVDFYVGCLSEWKDKPHLAPLASAYINWLAGEELSGKPMPDLSAQMRLNTLIQTAEWEEVLHHALISKLNESLDQKRWDAVEQFWSFTLSSSDNTPKLLGQLQQAVQAYIDTRFQQLIQDAMKSDSADLLDPAFRDLHQILPLLAQMEGHGNDYQKFLLKLVDQASLLLQAVPISPACDEIFSMLANSTSAPDPEQLLSVIKDKISKRFHQARGNHDTLSMTTLFDIAVKLGIDAIPTYSKEMIANLLADSRYLLNSDQLKPAQNQLQWILKLDPDNQQAKILLGSSYFAAGQFQEAASLLQAIAKIPSEVRQILSICYLRSGQGEKALALNEQMRRDKTTLGDRLLLETGLYLIDQKKWRLALDQLHPIAQKMPDIWVYMMACSYRLGDNKGVWQDFNQLPESMRINRFISALALRSTEAPELWGLASTIMEASLQAEPDKSSLTPTSKAFLEKHFEAYELDLSIAAAHYLQGSKQDPGRALSMLRGIDTNDWRIQCEKALALLQLRLIKEARRELDRLAPLPIDEAHLAYWLVKVQIAREGCEFGLAEQTLNQVEKSLGSRQEIALERARLYFDTMRPQLCLKELQPLISTANLDTQLLYMNTLAQMGQFEDALKQASIIAQKNHSAWSVWQTTSILYPAWSSLNMHWQLPTRNLFELLQPEQKALMLQKMIAMGEVTYAQNWAAQFQEELLGSFEGKFAALQIDLCTARLPLNLPSSSSIAQPLSKSVPAERLSLEKRVKDLTSFKDRTLSQSLRLLEWLEKLGDEAAIQSMASSLPDPLEWKNSKLPTAIQVSLTVPSQDTGETLSSCATYLALARVQLDKRHSLEESMLRRIEAIRALCESMRSDSGPIQFYWFFAQAQELMVEPFEAERELEVCIQNAPSFLIPYLHKAQLLASRKAWMMAIDTLKQAALYHPGHPWIQHALNQCRFDQLVAPLSIQANGEDGVKNKKVRLEPSQVHQLQLDVLACIEKAPYLPDAHLLAGRLFMSSGNWKEAYSEFMLADSLRPGKRDLLTLLGVCIEERLKSEGIRIEWQQQLFQIQQHLNGL